MDIYNWEISVREFCAQLPQNNFAYYFMKFVSYPGLWGWLLWLGLLVFIYRNKIKVGLSTLSLSIVAVLLGDVISRRIFKVLFMRPRPWSSVETCFDAHCWGFVSSHCTNITAFVTIFAFQDRKNLKWGIPAVLLVSISRVYILDHYPLDVLGGDILGFLIGLLVWKFYVLFRVFKNSEVSSNERKDAKRKAFRLLKIVMAAIFVAFIGYTSVVRITENFYEVDPGRFYRSAQLNPLEMSEKIQKYGIKTVISLRGAPEDSYWLKPEVELLKKNGVQFKFYGLDTDLYPTRSQLLGILEDFQSAPKPILIHCRSGADRTGMISALYVFEEMKKSKREALQQLGAKYWHFEAFHPAMDSFMNIYKGRAWASTYDRCVYPMYGDNDVCELDHAKR